MQVANFQPVPELDAPAPVPVTGPVEVTPVSSDFGEPGQGSDVRAVATGLQREADDTVVTARLTVRSADTGYVAVQAFLTGADGRVVQVISGRYYCLEQGNTRVVRLHLFHSFPPSLRLDRVVAYPLPVGVRPYVPGKCG